MKHKTTITALFILMFVTSATATSILEIDITEPDKNDPLVGDLIDVNATVDGQTDSITDVRLNVYENDTSIVENKYMGFDSGDTKQISYWFEPDNFELKDNSKYEISVVAVDNQGETDELLLRLNTTSSDVEQDVIDPENLNDDFVSKLLREFNLDQGIFSKGLSDLNLGEIVFIIIALIVVLWFFE